MSETTLLLGNALSREQFRCSPETLLIPVALATRLGALMPLTTLVELVRQAVCKIWNVSPGGPIVLLAGVPSSPELCDTPEIERHFASVIATIGVIEGIIGMAGCGVLSRISSRHGRKPALLLLLVAGIGGNFLIPMTQYMSDRLADWVFLLGLLFKLFSGPLLFAYLVNMYVVDISAPEDRTAALSRIAGWSTLGICISYGLGGLVTTKTGNPVIVFYVAAAIFVATLVYVLFILPESFPEEKRKSLSRMRLESSQSIDGAPTTTSISFLLIFEPLKMLLPTRRLNGTRNWRLTWCAGHDFVFSIANDYAGTAWLILVTSKYHLTPADTGLFLTVVTVSGTIVLMMIVPPLVRFLRPYYRRPSNRSHFAEDSTSNGAELEAETSDHLDVHLALTGCVVPAVFYLTAAASTTNQGLIISGICIGFGYVHNPTLRSLVAGSVDPLQQGEALAAIEIVASAGTLLSPTIMGSILTATISTTPLLVFYVQLVVFLISCMLLLPVRDADRYQKSHES